MTNEQVMYRRLLRRETHAPRTVPAVVVASIGAVLLLALLAGGVWWLVDEAFRTEAMRRIDDVAVLGQQQALPWGVGAGLALVALVLVALAVLPGRRARRARMTDRTALLVDDGVLADSVAASVARRTGVDRGRVSVIVGRRSVTVRITPTSGVPVDPAAAESAVVETLAGIGFTAEPRVVIDRNGVVA